MTLRISMLVLFLLSATLSPTVAQPPELSLLLDESPLQPGDTTVATVRLRHVDALLVPVSGAGLQLHFDRRLRLIDVQPGSLFGSDTLLLVLRLSDGVLAFSVTQRAGVGIRGDHLLALARFVVLPIAAHFGRVGLPRPDRSMLFAPTAAPMWDVPFAAHADVNGDGVVNERRCHRLSEFYTNIRFTKPTFVCDQPLDRAAGRQASDRYRVRWSDHGGLDPPSPTTWPFLNLITSTRSWRTSWIRSPELRFPICRCTRPWHTPM